MTLTRIILISLWLFFPGLGGQVRPQEKPAVADALQPADQLFRTGDLVGCAGKLDDFARTLPAAGLGELADYLKLRLKLSAARDPYPELLRQAQAMTEKYPAIGKDDTLDAAASELLDLHRNDEARKILRLGVDLAPQSFPSIRRFAEVYLRTGHGREALAVYTAIADRERKANPDYGPLAKAVTHKLAVQRPYFDQKIPDALIDVKYAFRIVRQDQFYQIDPARKVFRSEQTYQLENTARESTRVIPFCLNPQLTADSITLKDSAGVALPVKGWKIYTYDFVYLDGLPVFQLEVGRDIPAGQTVAFTVKYHLRPEAVQPAPEFWGDLTISPLASYAILPFGGNNVQFGLNIAAPFTMKVECPQGNLVCAPGERLATETKGDKVIASFRSAKANIPVFSCAPYRLIERHHQDLTLEYYLYPHETFPEELADQLFAALELYRGEFGEVGASAFRIATSGPYHATVSNGENKGNCSFVTDYQLPQTLKSPNGRANYLVLMFHEFFHNWNLFNLNWQGDYAEWFGEGGASFIQAWAAEKVLGQAAGRQARQQIAERLVSQEGFNCRQTLAKVEKKGPLERSLIYHYGALVWEQCRQKLGDEAFFKGWRDFFRLNAGKTVTMADLLKCWAPYTTVDVAAYLDP